MTINYKPVGVCSREMKIEVEDNIIKNIEIFGGCDGNLKGISKLVVGQNVDEVIERLKGISCGPRPSSCPDQLAKALESARA